MLLTLADAAEPTDTLGELHSDAQAVYWLARCPQTGDMQLWGWTAGSNEAPQCLIEDAVGSRVNQYGGGSYTPLLGGVVWVRQQDQAIMHLDHHDASHCWQKRPQTAYGGLCADPKRQRVLAVEEDTHGQRLIALTASNRHVLTEGADFYGAPILSDDGNYLAWVSWSLPNMPWQRSQLHLAQVAANGRLEAFERWDFGAAISQPQFGPHNALICMSDHAGWWQPWQVNLASPLCLSSDPVDHITTPWQLGERQHAWRSSRQLYCQLHQGAAQLYRRIGEQVEALLPAPGRVASITLAEHGDYAIVQSATSGAQLIHFAENRPRRCLVGNIMGNLAGSLNLVDSLVTKAPAAAQWLEAPVGSEGDTVHGFFYSALESHYAPLIVRIHGGPTAATYPVYDPLVVYWQQQGFHVLDINPRGSGNFGRSYRECLAGQWGISDTDDVIALVNAACLRFAIDKTRCFIRGQSAGGFTALNALAATPLFTAATSLYGVTDALTLAAKTHRFESGYLGWLIGDEPLLAQRSPAYQVSRCQRPLRALFIQGGKDVVVVPEQTHAMARHIQRHGGQAQTLLFDNERHGIRHPKARQTMLARELAFYQ
ncbi:alpha/beta hydrolase family protein [Vreelandella boliviensis]|uniref:Dipeptidyl peptidase family member 6 n=1 Tax=Vreelandella boliviensis LC1 TaxID=1072583 RepID=A0A265E2S8_9GAMM|nr:prolyl oligopeptidase family serine peptidase [Halomonas boliviensis]EHJ94598.1 Dipeptidyl peptidase family member 6 [Halomonas boliviensis LC1]OZT75558.1 S9 family peptidase [Halomonas boliviensis LC1]